MTLSECKAFPGHPSKYDTTIRWDGSLTGTGILGDEISMWDALGCKGPQSCNHIPAWTWTFTHTLLGITSHRNYRSSSIP